MFSGDKKVSSARKSFANGFIDPDTSHLAERKCENAFPSNHSNFLAFIPSLGNEINFQISPGEPIEVENKIAVALGPMPRLCRF